MQLGSFRIQIDSLICLVFRCPSLSKILAPDQFMTWFSFSTWPVMADLFISAALLFRSDRVNVLLLIDSTFICVPLVSSHNFCQSLQYIYMYSRSCGMESCTHILQFALLCVDLLGGLAAVAVSCRASRQYLFHIYGVSSQQSRIPLLHMGWLLILYSPVLTCFFYLCLLSFSFSDIGRASLCRKSTLDFVSSAEHS